MNVTEILAQIEDLSAEQLCEFIRKEVVTITQLKDTGRLDASKRNTINTLLNEDAKKNKAKQEECDRLDNEHWESVRYGSEDGIRDYISKFPNGLNTEEAKKIIKRIEDDRDIRWRRKEEILRKLSQNPNSCTPGMIHSYIQDGMISKEELSQRGIPERIVERICEITQPYLELGETPTSIPNGFTEVYFWGIPGSGKTCALAAILSTAEKKGYLDIATGPGYNYMTLLKNIFIKPNAILPPPSPVETTQYLPFVLRKNEREKPRSVSLIELSGEIFQCFFLKNANKSLQSQQHENTFNSLLNFLRSDNRKIHFFFIDFEKENDVDVDGYTQGDYLTAASTFFKNNDIFRKTTDAIYIVITKSDLMPNSDTYEKSVIYAKQHLESNNFLAFIKTLKSRCQEHSINAGKLTVEPFSLGKVYFQQICDFDDTAASRIVDILIDRIKPNRKSVLDVFNK